MAKEPIHYQVVDQLVSTTMGTLSKIASSVSPIIMNRQIAVRYPNVSYGSHPEQLLDIYLPSGFSVQSQSRLPVTLLIHGGGFRFFSKNSHAHIASQMASTGRRVVFVMDYRLIPQNPFPTGLLDVIHAYSWMIQNAQKYGGDLNQISLVGESAGGNYSLALCLYLFGMQGLDSRHPIPPIPQYKPKRAIIHCGHLHVSNVDRYEKMKKEIGILISRRIQQITRDYLPEKVLQSEKNIALADPLIEIEKLVSSNGKLPNGFPQFFVPVGDRDPVRGDSIRLAKALEQLGQKDRLKIYPGEGHAFYVYPFKRNAKLCWDDIHRFLNSEVFSSQFVASHAERQSEISS